ncbi:MAG: hypothetical protein V1754_00680 [Pseudomonadota bacterium]
MKRTPTRRFLVSIVGLAMISTSAWAENVILRGTSPQGGSISVPVARAKAVALRQTAQALNRAGCRTYLNIWTKTNPNTRSFPAGKGFTLVAAVTNKAAWAREYGGKTIGFICNGSPHEPGYSGYMRAGDKVFTYSTIRAGEYHTYTYTTRPQNISSWGHEHVESTFEATPAEVKAFKVFYFARANNAILDPRTGQPHMPEWVNPGTSSWKQEGCAGASTSALNSKWQAAFRNSMDNIRQKGRELGIPEMANATADMADSIAAFTNRYALKQETTPKTLARSWGVALANHVTIFNAGNQIPPDVKQLYWDQTFERYDGDNGWGGLCKWKIPSFPDKGPNEPASGSYRNVRLDPLHALTAAL